MSTSTRVSYGVLAFTIILAGFLHLGGPLLAAFFSFLALKKLRVLTKRKWLALILFGLVAIGLAFAAVYFTRAAVHALPEVAERSIPSASAWAQARQIELPFSDVETLRDFFMDSIKEQARYLQNVAHLAGRTTTWLLFTLIAIVAASSLFLKSSFNPYGETHAVKNNLYSIYSDEVSSRFSDFYHSFSTVMGAQIMISSINTVLTAIFVLAIQLPYAPLAIAITFLCGLVPIVGNIISNTIIVFLALTVSLKLAIGALVFLVLIHKLEYFLNSKIIGSRIRNPVWLTLIALIIGERLMGIPGLILAPVVLNYLRVEMLKIEVPRAPQKNVVAMPEVESLNR
jgi:predicted PurR-regulated permease PerM